MKTKDWLKALRSGKYKQGKEQLADGAGGFCCLGVLCEAAGVPKEVTTTRDEPDEPLVRYIFTRLEDLDLGVPGRLEKADACIPSFEQGTILEDLDLRMRVAGMDFDGCQASQSLHDRLMNLNDGGKTFEDIANYIQQVKKAGK